MSWVAVAVAGAGIAAGVGGGVMGAQNEQSSRKVMRDTAQGGVQSLYRTVPNQLMFNQAYDPSFSALGEQNLERLLFGAEADTIQIPKYSTKGDLLGMQSINRPGQRGVIDLLGEATPAFGKLRDDRATENLQFLETNLPRAQEFYRASNPDLMALRDALNESAQLSVKAGSKLLPEDAYRLTSGVRSDWANRGLGTSAPAQLDEAVQLAVGGENMRLARQGQSRDIFATLSATEPDYANFLMGLGDDTAIANAFNLVSGNQAFAHNKDFDPMGGGMAALGGLGANLQYQQGANQADMLAGLGGGLLSLSGKIYGG